MLKKIQLAFCLLVISATLFGQNRIQSPDEFFPHKLGEQFTGHALLVDYFKYVAANSNRVKLVEFGRTNQGRPQLLAIVSSPENLQRIEDIRLNNLRNTGLAAGQPDNSKPYAIVWLGFSVHGNEAAGAEASPGVLYDLVNPANTEALQWLQNTVVLMEPVVNPDGYSRYADWYRSVSPKVPDPDPKAREHDEPWPGGRTNHYYYDLNRDWAWATQVESQNRLKIYNEWMPHVAADLHEQGYTEPYYFAPAAQPYHTFLTKWQSDFQVDIGKNHAKYFDKNGWLYFTKEVFDLFYPSYGDTYPCYNGAIGMTYEQGGSGRAGRAIQLPNGDTLTLFDRVAHHRTTALSTVEVSSKNAARLVENFNDYFKKSQNNPPGQYKTFIIRASNPVHKLRSLTDLLDRHLIRYGKAGKATPAVTAYDYSTGKETRVSVNENDLLVSVYQPKGLLTQVLFEPTAALVDSLTYDITAWDLPHAFGLDAFASKQRIDHSQVFDFEKTTRTPQDAKPYAYIAGWNSFQSARFLSGLLNKNIVARYAEKEFSTGGKTYAPGTLLITRADNRKHADFDKTVRETAAHFDYPLILAESGFVSSGPDFGSDYFRLISKPKVLLLSGEKTFSNEFGQIWFYFDRELELPATIIDADRLSGTDLNQYNLLVLAEGFYGFDEGTLDKLNEWISKGGRLISTGAANRSLEDKKGFNLARFANPSGKEDAEKKANEADLGSRTDTYDGRVRRSLSDDAPGAIVKVKMDVSHPLAFGMKEYYFSLKTNRLRYDLLKNSWNAGYLENDLLVHGFIGANLKNSLKNSAVFAVQDKGRGKVIYLIDNPLFRSFWEEGKLLFSNAVFLVN